MYSLIVSGVAGYWEGDNQGIALDRFNTYSGQARETIKSDDPDSLAALDGSPALVFYETGVVGPNAGIVRHGRLRNVARYGRAVTFDLEPDPARPFLPRQVIGDLGDLLDMHRFEQTTTHWAIKDGRLPPHLLKTGFSALPQETPEALAQAYRLAVERDNVYAERALRRALSSLPEGEAARAARAAAGLTEQAAPAMPAPAAPPPGDRPALLSAGARVVVLIVGLETYRTDRSAQIGAVAFARADAEAFRDRMAELFHDHSPEFTLRLDEQATHATLVNDVRSLAYSLDEDDLFVFYFAGHGFHDASGNRLTAWDTSMVNLEGTTLSVAEDLLAPLQASGCQKILGFIDACATNFRPLGRRTVTDLDIAEFAQMLGSAQFCATFLSCRPGEQSYPDSDLGHGVWTYFLLRALSGQVEAAISPERYVTNASLQDYLRREVPRHTVGNPRIGAVQTPQAVVTTTNTFAIRHVPEIAAAPSGTSPPPVPPAAPGPDSEAYVGTSTAFFAERFARAFPGVRRPRWFTEPEEIQRRLMRLLGPPIRFASGSPIWWWADGNLQIQSFDHVEGRRYLMDGTELEIRRIAAVPGHAYWGHFVYVEVAAMPPVSPDVATPVRIAASIAVKSYADEDYGLFDGRIPVSRAEFDDGAAEIAGDLVDLAGRVVLRHRYLTPYSFLIAAHGSPVNDNRFDADLSRLLRAVREDDGFEALVAAVAELPKRN